MPSSSRRTTCARLPHRALVPWSIRRLGPLIGALALSGAAGAGTCLCPGDLNVDRTVDAMDLGILLDAWSETPSGRLGPCESPDLDGDGTVDSADLGLLLAAWGPCEAATGACCSSAGCKPLTLEECETIGGAFAGAGVACGPTGPCCFADGTCDELPEACCVLLGGFFQGAVGTCATITCVMVDLDVDTNRDADIDGSDDADEDKWTKDRGALYIVNCNDSDNMHDEDGLRFDQDHDPVHEDFVIDGEGDVADITPFVVRATGPLPAGATVTLEATLDDITKIHVFDSRDPGEVSNWGGVLEADLKYDITMLLDEDEDLEMGLEGLYFRFIEAGHPMDFDGFIDLTLVVKDAAAKVIGKDTVRLKVAPYIVLPNTQEAQEIFAKATTPGFDNADFLTDLKAALPAAPGPPILVPYMTDSRWAQDPLETGYTRVPESFMWVSAHTLHQGDLAGGDVQWARDLLLNKARGLYRSPAGPMWDSGDFGGNLELLPPTTNHPLGRLCVGNTMSTWKRGFLGSQEVQPMVFMQPPYAANTPIDTKWLAVGHVDETVGFIAEGPHQIVIASPKRAYGIIGAPFGPLPIAGSDEPAEDFEVFFADGETSPGILAGGVSGPNGYTVLVPGIDFTGGTWQYLRIVDVPGDEEHPAIGQTAHIVALGNGFIEIESVQAAFDIDLTTGASGDGCAGGQCTLGYNPDTTTEGWFVTPPAKFVIVLAEGTQFWPAIEESDADSAGFVPAPGFPKPSAIVTVFEVRKNAKLRALNLKCQERLDAIRAALTNAMGGDMVTFIEVPVIYTTKAPLDVLGEIVPRSCVAWNPGLANVLVAGGKFIFPKQFGPKKAGKDRFEKAVEDSLGAVNVRFVNDWKNYHTQMGEVHCGTNALREPYTDPWWENQP